MEDNIYFPRRAARSVSINLLNDRADQIFFVGVFLLGALLITGFKAWGLGPFVPLCFSVLLVVGYGVASLNSPMLHLPEERVADNSYYLGFLFTLVSLSNALYYFAAESYTARMLVSNFGVALGSTIAGVMARIVIQQMRVDTETVNKQVKESLAQAAQTTIADLHNFIAEVGVLSQTFKETLTKNVESISVEVEQSAALAKTIWAKLDEHLREYDQAAGQIGDKNREAVSALERATSSVAAAVAGIERDLRVASELASARIVATSVPVPSEAFDQLKAALQQTAEALQDVTARVSALDAQVSAAGPLARIFSFLKGK